MTPISLGPIVVAAAGTPVRLEASSRRCRRIVVQPLPSNYGPLYVGLSGMNVSTNVGVLQSLTEISSGPYLSLDGKRFGASDGQVLVGARIIDEFSEILAPALPGGRCGLDWFDLQLSSDATFGDHTQCFVIFRDREAGDFFRFRIQPGERVQSPSGWMWASSVPGSTLTIILANESGDPLSLASGDLCINAGGSDQLVPCREYARFDTGISTTSYFDSSTFFIDAELDGDGAHVAVWTP